MHFYKALQALPNGSIVAIAVSDEGSMNLRPFTREILAE
jgi:hypothetical protein